MTEMNCHSRGKLEMLVDFYDDMLFANAPLYAEDIDRLFERLANSGIQSVSWYYHADERGGWIQRFLPSPDVPERSRFAVYRECCVMRRACVAAHKHNLRFIIGFKPYETGLFGLDLKTARKQNINTVEQLGRMITAIDPFVVTHPDLRLRLRPELRTADPMPRIGRIELWKADDAPTRIKKENLEILVSDINLEYRKLDVTFDFSEEIRVNTDDETDLFGKVISRKGQKVRVLTLSGLDFSSRYWAVQCTGLKGDGDFHGLGNRMMRVFDVNGNPVHGCFARKYSICDKEFTDLAEHGGYFDIGYGQREYTLDDPGEYTAFTAQLSEYVTGALCETEPAVQRFWLDCVDNILDAGVDGVEFRIENHSHMSDHSLDYGFNDAVLELAGKDASDATIAKVRGDAFTDFLRKAAANIRARGKISRLYISIDRLTEPLPADRLLAWPQNIEYQWERWLDEGLADEVVFRVFNFVLCKTALKNPLTDKVAEKCRQCHVPMVFSHYVRNLNDPWYIEESERIVSHERFAGLS
ncbi:MAG: hypothetical protein J6X55_10790, partial [Victivallales bacterium]|nr:hypothetical protein [Victivallales bacterium]